MENWTRLFLPFTGPIRRIVWLCVSLISISVEPSHAQNFNFDLPLGFCSLERRNSADAALIKTYSDAAAKSGERLVMAAVRCSDLNAWRNPPTIPTFKVQFYVSYAPHFDNLDDRGRLNLPSQFCQKARELSGGSLVGALDIKKAIDALKEISDSAIVGPIRDTQGICYLTSVAKVQIQTGENVNVLHIRAVAVINRHILNFYMTDHIRAGYESDSFNSMLRQLEDAVIKTQAANR